MSITVIFGFFKSIRAPPIMNEANTNYLKQHIDILSFCELAPDTVATYSSYITQFIDWAEASLPDKSITNIS